MKTNEKHILQCNTCNKHFVASNVFDTKILWNNHECPELTEDDLTLAELRNLADGNNTREELLAMRKL